MMAISTMTRRAPATASPGPPRRIRGRLRELCSVAFGSLVVAAAMTWPTLRHPTQTVPQDLGDPLYFVWQVAWTGHALVTDPGSMYTTNAFARAPGNLAYTDTVLGYAPFAAAVNGIVPGLRGALLTYNLLYVLAVALSFAGAYLLARVLGARISGALVLAAGFAFAPWHLAHVRHLNVISAGGIALSLALIAYGHGWSFRPDGRREARPGWIVVGWLVACWQLSLGFALGVPFAWVLLLVLATAALSWLLRGRPKVPVRVLVASGVGFACFGLAGVLLALPYQRVVNSFPVARRTEEMVHIYSPKLRDLVTAPPENWLWGSAQSSWTKGMVAVSEQTLLPGVVLIVLALIGLGYSAWTVRHRVLLALAALVSLLFALGTSAPGGGHWTYLVIFRYLPGFEAVRTPGRLILWTTLALGLLAAGAVTKAADRFASTQPHRQIEGQPDSRVNRVRRRPTAARRRLISAFLLVPALLILVEGVGRMPQPNVPKAPVALTSLPGLTLVIPTSMSRDYMVMTWSTQGWPELINGGSGFEPPGQSELRRTALRFPRAEAVATLRAEGVRTVVLVRSLAVGSPYENLASHPDLWVNTHGASQGVTMRFVPNAVVYSISPEAPPTSTAGTGSE
jgi:hypothetical protein